MYALSVTFNVSRTLWSVINMPICFSPKMIDNSLNIEDCNGVDACERLVEQNEGRRNNERARNLYSSPFTS